MTLTEILGMKRKTCAKAEAICWDNESIFLYQKKLTINEIFDM